MPERRLTPPASAGGWLTSHFGDQPKLPAFFHPSENESQSMAPGSAVSSLLRFQDEDLVFLLCFT